MSLYIVDTYTNRFLVIWVTGVWSKCYKIKHRIQTINLEYWHITAGLPIFSFFFTSSLVLENEGQKFIIIEGNHHSGYYILFLIAGTSRVQQCNALSPNSHMIYLIHYIPHPHPWRSSIVITNGIPYFRHHLCQNIVICVTIPCLSSAELVYIHLVSLLFFLSCSVSYWYVPFL